MILVAEFFVNEVLSSGKALVDNRYVIPYLYCMHFTRNIYEHNNYYLPNLLHLGSQILMLPSREPVVNTPKSMKRKYWKNLDKMLLQSGIIVFQLLKVLYVLPHLRVSSGWTSIDLTLPLWPAYVANLTFLQISHSMTVPSPDPVN